MNISLKFPNLVVPLRPAVHIGRQILGGIPPSLKFVSELLNENSKHIRPIRRHLLHVRRMPEPPAQSAGRLCAENAPHFQPRNGIL